jgi:hypothetical protein
MLFGESRVAYVAHTGENDNAIQNLRQKIWRQKLNWKI